MGFPWVKVKTAFSFFLRSKSKYRIHSPFVFGLITKAIEKEVFHNKKLLEKAAEILEEIQKKNETFSFQFIGAGSNLISQKKKFQQLIY